MPGENDALVRRFEEAFAANDVTTIDELCDPNLVDHNPAPGQEPTLNGFKATTAMYKESFPDSRTDLHAVIGEGDLVASHWTVTGTHQAEFLGVPATGQRVTVEGMNVYRLTGGIDGLGLMQQLGALPPS